jgi:sulfatase maturation enzyme AslB (radical SAM superfamily)
VTAARPGLADVTGVARVDVVLTAQCNLRCQYCYQNARQDLRMSEDTLRAALGLLQGSGQWATSLTFYGGEPLLEPGLIVAALELAAGWPAPWRLSVSMATNGTLLRGEIVGELVRHRVHTQVSLDGVAAAQKLRGRGTYRLVTGALAELAGSHPTYFRELVSVGVTVSSQNVRHLAASVASLVRADVKKIEIGPLLGAGPGWTEEDTAALETEVEKVFHFSLRNFERTGEVPVSLLRNTGGQPELDPTGGDLCRAASGRNLTVDADGQVYGCVLLAESYQELPPGPLGGKLAAMRLGHIADPAFPERLAAFPAAARAAGVFSDRELKWSSFGRCANCSYRRICNVCPVAICHIPGNADPHRVPDHECAFYRTWGRWRERFPVQHHPLDVLLGRGPAPPWMRRMQGAKA